MINPHFLEVSNGVIALGGIIVLAIIIRYLMSGMATGRGSRVARALAMLIAGIVIFRAWIWLWRHIENDGGDAKWMVNYPVPYVGLVVTIIGMFCLVRVLSFSHAPGWVWALVMTVTIAAMTAVAFV